MNYNKINIQLAALQIKLEHYQQLFEADGHVDNKEQKKLETLQADIAQAEQLLRFFQETSSLQGSGQAVPMTKAQRLQGVLSPSFTTVAAPAKNPLTANPDIEQNDQGKWIDATTTGLVGDLFKKGAGDQDAVHWNDVAQGQVENCYFLSAVAALAKSDPQAIKNLIKGPDSNGNYQVTLYVNVQKGTVAATSKTITLSPEILVNENNQPIYAGKGDAELWVMLIEKAYALLRKETLPENEVVQGLEDGYGAMNIGFGEQALEAITGKDAGTHWLHKISREETIQHLSKASKDNTPLTAGSIHAYNKDLGETPSPLQKTAEILSIVLGHEYFLLQFEESSSQLTLQNPWNKDVEGGKELVLHVDDFITYFRYISTAG